MGTHPVDCIVVDGASRETSDVHLSVGVLMGETGCHEQRNTAQSEQESQRHFVEFSVTRKSFYERVNVLV